MPTAAASLRCARWLEQLNAPRAGSALDTLSMGMSGDFREAIAEGATMVRIGTALFRPTQQPAPLKPGLVECCQWIHGTG